MFYLLIPLCLALLVQCFRGRGEGLRWALLSSFTIMSAIVWSVTELLGALHAFDSASLVTIWSFILVFLVWLTAKYGRFEGYRNLWDRKLWFIALLTAVPPAMVAWFWPPNNFDVLTYHLPRILHWEQNASVAHYSTGCFRQLYQPPLMEYWLANLHLMGAGERAFTLLPIGVLVLAGLSASILAEHVSLNKWAGLVAFVLILTVPVAVLHGSSPKNDILLAGWLLGALCYLLRFWRTPSFIDFAGVVLCSILAILTKGTAWLYFPAVGICLVVALWSNRNCRSTIPWLKTGAVLLFATAALVPHHYRNWETFKNPLGVRPEHGEATYSNEKFSAAVVLSNLTRNLAIELQSPFIPVNRTINLTVEKLHLWMGIEPSSALTTWPGTSFDVSGPWRVAEDEMPNPAQILLIIAAVLCTTLRFRNQSNAASGVVLVVLLAGFFLFVSLLKWQPWHSRLHIPLLFLGMVLVARWITSAWNVWLQGILLSCLFAHSFWVVWVGSPRPLRLVFATGGDRDQLFDLANPGFMKDLRGAMTKLIALGPDEIGLVASRNEWEYPVWRLKQKVAPTLKMQRYDSSIPGHNVPSTAPSRTAFLSVNNGVQYAPSLLSRSFVPAFGNGTFEIYVAKSFRDSNGDTVEFDSDSIIKFEPSTWYSEESSAGTSWRWCAEAGAVDIRVLPGTASLAISFSVASPVSNQVIRLIDDGVGQLAEVETVPGGRHAMHLSIKTNGRASVRLIWQASSPHIVPRDNLDRRQLSFALYDLKVISTK